MKLRRDSTRAGAYVTLDGRYQIERQENYTECSHPLCWTLHAALQGNGDLPGHEVTYYEWIVWDVMTDDYAGGHPTFDTKRQAVAWLEDYLGEVTP